MTEDDICPVSKFRRRTVKRLSDDTGFVPPLIPLSERAAAKIVCLMIKSVGGPSESSCRDIQLVVGQGRTHCGGKGRTFVRVLDHAAVELPVDRRERDRHRDDHHDHHDGNDR